MQDRVHISARYNFGTGVRISINFAIEGLQ